MELELKSIDFLNHLLSHPNLKSIIEFIWLWNEPIVYVLFYIRQWVRWFGSFVCRRQLVSRCWCSTSTAHGKISWFFFFQYHIRYTDTQCSDKMHKAWDIVVVDKIANIRHKNRRFDNPIKYSHYWIILAFLLCYRFFFVVASFLFYPCIVYRWVLFHHLEPKNFEINRIFIYFHTFFTCYSFHLTFLFTIHPALKFTHTNTHE